MLLNSSILDPLGGLSKSASASGGSWSPPDGILWFNADAETGYANNDPVSLATDQTGNGHDATQSGGSRLTYKTNQINGKAAFYGTSQFMVTASIAHNIGTNDFTVGAVVNFAANTASYHCIYNNGTTQPGLYILTSFGTGVLPIFEQYYSGVGDQLFNTRPTIGQWYSLLLVRSSGVCTLYVNGVADATTRNLSNSVPNGAFTFGAGVSGSDPWNGYIAEIFMTSSAMDADARTEHSAYISSTYGL